LERLAQASLPLLVQLAAEKPELAGPLADAVAADLTAAATPAAATSFHSSGAAAAPAVPAVSASFSAYCNVPDVSCTVPRGKHDIEFSERSIVFRPKSGAAGSATLEVPRHTVSGVFHLVTKEHQHLLLSLSEPVTIGKAQHSVLAVCESAEALRKAAAAGAKKNASGAGFSVPLLREVAGEQLKDAAALAAVTRADRAALEGDSSVAVLKALAGSLVGRVGETDLALFKSARGNSFVRCYVGVNDGMLFPLRRAFVFVGKPLLVLPHADVAKAQVERGGAYGPPGERALMAVLRAACFARDAGSGTTLPQPPSGPQRGMYNLLVGYGRKWVVAAVPAGRSAPLPTVALSLACTAIVPHGLLTTASMYSCLFSAPPLLVRGCLCRRRLGHHLRHEHPDAGPCCGGIGQGVAAHLQHGAQGGARQDQGVRGHAGVWGGEQRCCCCGQWQRDARRCLLVISGRCRWR